MRGRVVAQLLALMDGLKSRGKGSGYSSFKRAKPSGSLHLRRPGRFDREIEINVPSKDGRLDILKIHTRNMPLVKNVNLKEIAAVDAWLCRSRHSNACERNGNGSTETRAA